MSVYLCLFNGRQARGSCTNFGGFGFNGPVFEFGDGFHMPHPRQINFGDARLYLTDGWVYYDKKWYKEWAVIDEVEWEKQSRHPVEFNRRIEFEQNKADLPKAEPAVPDEDDDEPPQFVGTVRTGRLVRLRTQTLNSIAKKAKFSKGDKVVIKGCDAAFVTGPYVGKGLVKLYLEGESRHTSHHVIHAHEDVLLPNNAETFKSEGWSDLYGKTKVQ